MSRRSSRESTESRASSADSKMEKEKLNLPSTRSRKKSLSECSDTSSIAEESSGRTRRGLRAPSDRSESPAPRSSARLSTRSSARRRQAEDSASPTKQPPTPSPTPPPPPAPETATVEKPATRQNRSSKRKQAEEEVPVPVPEKKAKEDVGTDEKTKPESAPPKGKRGTSPVKVVDEIVNNKTKAVQKPKTQPKGKEDHQTQGKNFNFIGGLFCN